MVDAAIAKLVMLPIELASGTIPLIITITIIITTTTIIIIIIIIMLANCNGNANGNDNNSANKTCVAIGNAISSGKLKTRCHRIERSVFVSPI